MDESQERQLALGLQAGRPEAWRALYETYAGPVWQSVARRLGPGSADVADVVQETFLGAARSARSYDPARGSLWLWLVGIARNHVALHYRRQERQVRLQRAQQWLAASDGRIQRWLEGVAEAPGEALAAAELSILVRAALSELPPEYETLLTARYLDDVSVEQLATAERSSPTAIRAKLARARRAFREILVRPPFASVSPDRKGTS